MAIRYFVQIGAERIELGQDAAKKEDPFRPLSPGVQADHWEAETIVNDQRYVAVSNDSLKDAAARLDKKLPADVTAPDKTKRATAKDTVRTKGRA